MGQKTKHGELRFQINRLLIRVSRSLQRRSLGVPSPKFFIYSLLWQNILLGLRVKLKVGMRIHIYPKHWNPYKIYHQILEQWRWVAQLVLLNYWLFSSHVLLLCLHISVERNPIRYPDLQQSLNRTSKLGSNERVKLSYDFLLCVQIWCGLNGIRSLG